ncbi:hypothetical protein R1flu_013397 [Riccia fluitans]|uniref:Disease resistance R13L4/SHOC-2-like LRR domain-containing protein n=1 Tax=Riccia fluitans TaxID=41844 RepID=A0ABD1YD88_9MARC
MGVMSVGDAELDCNLRKIIMSDMGDHYNRVDPGRILSIKLSVEALDDPFTHAVPGSFELQLRIAYRASPKSISWGRSKSCCQRLLLYALIFTVLHCNGHRAGAQDYGATNSKELAALYDVLSGIDSNTNWTRELPDPCNNWQTGIYCLPDNDGELHVTNLAFGIMSEYVPVIPCSSHASLHPSVSKFPYLQSLQLFSCFTNPSQPTFMPKEIGMLKELQILTFQDNRGLVGTLPVELGSLSSLQRLCVTMNGIGGSIPSELGSLVSLIQLDLGRNQLEGPIPASLNSLVNLRILDLRGNLFSGNLPTLDRLTSLVKMVLSENNLNGSIPSDLGQLRSLRFLDLSHNSFTGGLPPSVVNLRSLEDLFVGYNPMGTSLPGFIWTMTALTRLTLEQSNYMGSIPREFGNITSLRVLVLEGNKLTGAIPPELGSLPNLHILDLSGNNLSGPVPFSPEMMERTGISFNLMNNSGLCIPHSSRTRVAVASVGLSSCSMESSEPAYPIPLVESPSMQPGSWSPSRSCSSRRSVIHMPILVILVSIFIRFA